MDLSEELAQKCMTVKRAQPADIERSREEFEDLAARERIARGHADRMRTIARSRAREEAEKTPLETFTGRLYPVPHTLGEAAWRVPAIAAGGIMGAQAAGRTELPGAEGIAELTRPGKAIERTVPTGEHALSRFGERIRLRLQTLGHPNAEVTARWVEGFAKSNPRVFLENTMAQAFPGVHSPPPVPTPGPTHAQVLSAPLLREELAGLGVHTPQQWPGDRDFRQAFQRFQTSLTPGEELTRATTRPGLSDFGTRLRERLEAMNFGGDAEATARRVETVLRENPAMARKALSMRPTALLGEEALGVRSAVEEALGEGGKPLAREVMHGAGSKAKMLSEGVSRWRRYGGASLGALAAILLTGVPLGLHALWKRRQGGEAAARAKARMEQELGKAEEASTQREEILKRLGA